MSFLKKQKPSFFLASLFLLTLIIIPPCLSLRTRNKKNSPKNSVCLWKNPLPQKCPGSKWVVKKDSQGCPYLYCLKQREVLGEKSKVNLVRLTAEKETFQPGETVIIKMKNISGRRINLPNKLSWEIKKITNQKEQPIVSQTTTTVGLTLFERSNVFKFSWNQKDQRGKTASPGHYQFVTQVEDQPFSLNFNISASNP